MSHRVVDLECHRLLDDFSGSQRKNVTCMKFFTTMCTMFYFTFMGPILETSVGFEDIERVVMPAMLATNRELKADTFSVKAAFSWLHAQQP